MDVAASSMRKSVEDLLVGSGEAIGANLNQALNFTNSTMAKASPALLRRRSPSPSEPSQPSHAKVTMSSSSGSSGSQSMCGNSSRIDQYLSVSYNSDQHDGGGSEDSLYRSGGSSIGLNNKSSDGSHSSPSDGSSRNPLALSNSAHDIDRAAGKGKVPEHAKKTSWYSALYPSYKSRTADYKKLFKDIPSDERLLVDYSSALQRDILLHGRLYVSQNYLCFYSNIFGWETNLTIKLTEVTGITKEKTALVIPNAIFVCTATEKFFFTSFTSRDNAYLMLFRVWQNALMKKTMTPKEMWQWVHFCYGDELGLTTDDEDYIDPYEGLPLNKKGKPIKSLTSSEICGTFTDSVSEEHSNPESDNTGGGGGFGSGSGAGTFQLGNDHSQRPGSCEGNSSSSGSSSTGPNKSHTLKSSNNNRPVYDFCGDKDGGSGTQMVAAGGSMNVSSGGGQEKRSTLGKGSRIRNDVDGAMEHAPTDMSDTSDSEQEKNLDLIRPAECTSNHEGRQMIHTILPINVDILFTLLFSKSKFLENFHANRKTTDLVFGDWILEDSRRLRTVTLTVALTQPVGPKCSHVTEKQTLRECSVPGQLYSVDIISTNGGIPYAESFYVTMHYCMVRTVDDHTMFSVHAQIQYKKSVWGVVKGFIEKNTWNGLEDFYTALVRALQTEYGIPPAKAKSRRVRRGTTQQKQVEPFDLPSSSQTVKAKSSSSSQYANVMAVNPQTVAETTVQNKSMSLFVIILLLLLIVLNVVLYVKLWDLEKSESVNVQYPDFKLSPIYSQLFRDPPKSHEDWIKIMQDQERLHNAEMAKWQSVLQIAVDLLRKVSVVCRKIVSAEQLDNLLADSINDIDGDEGGGIEEALFGKFGRDLHNADL